MLDLIAENRGQLIENLDYSKSVPGGVHMSSSTAIDIEMLCCVVRTSWYRRIGSKRFSLLRLRGLPPAIKIRKMAFAIIRHLQG